MDGTDSVGGGGSENVENFASLFTIGSEAFENEGEERGSTSRR